MTNEGVVIETPTRFISRTIADAAAVPIGSIMKLTSDNTCALSTADNDVFAGIAWEEKTANDGITKITLALDGIWDLKYTAIASVAGAIVGIGGADNTISDSLAADVLQGSAVGKSEEDANNTYGRVKVGYLC